MAPAAEPAEPGTRRLAAAGSSTPGSASTTGIDDIRAAIGLGQLEKLDEILALRAAVAARYTELLDGIEGLELPCADDADHERSWFVYVVALPRATDREAVIATLDARGIQTARYLPCIHLQPYMRERYGFREGLCPVAEDASSRTLALPFHARLDEDDQAYVAEALARRARVNAHVRARARRWAPGLSGAP